ncbi:MAG: FG-GAP-like repeat-containing protein [Flavobacteriales bacterium]
MPHAWLLGMLCTFGAAAATGATERSPFIPTPEAATYRVPNAVAGFDARVHPFGFSLERGDAAPGRMSMQVAGIGREQGGLLPWRPGTVQDLGTELYVPGSHLGVHYQAGITGLRQNFFVFAPPAGAGRVRITLELGGDLRPALLADGVLAFEATDGRALLHYKDLHCWDAEGRTLPGSFVLEQGRLHIVVDDRGASYPITIDPVSTTPSTLLVGTIAGGEFGISVCTAGDLNGDGRSDVAVGAWQAPMNGLNTAGAVYVYYGSNTGISTTPSVTLAGTQQGGQFGCSVSTAGDVNGDGFSDLLVGSRTWESDVVNELSEGSVFIFHGSATGINTVPDLQLQPNHADDNFGSNVACAGDINNDGYSDILVGAYLSSYPTFNEGAVFVYLGSATGINPVAQHRLERNQGGAFFGRSLAGAGDVNGDGYSDVIIGASKFIYTTGASDQGSAFIYHGGPTGLGGSMNPAPTLQLFGSGGNVAYYGWWVTSAGDLNGDGYSDVAVSAYADESGGQTDEGIVYVYHGSPTGVNGTAVVTLQSNQNTAWMGRCVSTVGDVNGDGYGDLMVGTPRYTGPESLEGICTVYLGSPTGISTAASFQMELNSAGANFGESVCSAGDVNGDGYTDMIAGARIYGNAGAAAVFLGGPYSTNLTPTATRFSALANARLGAAVANAGDVNGDGYADALFGAPGASNGQAGEGLVYLHYGSATGLAAAPSLTLEVNVAGAQFGTSVSTAGDVNGDGYADVVIGAPANGNGAAYVFMGGAGGLSTAPSATLTGGTQCGRSVATAGDVDHDGFADVIIGSPGTGEARIFEGSPTGIVTTPVVVLSELPASGLFGTAVATAGDVNGDGYSDVIVGAPQAANGQANEGLAYVYHGGATSITTTYARMLEVNQAAAGFGISVSGAGDVNGDGFFDVVVGADLWESGQTDEGAAFVFHGSATGIAAAPASTLQRNITDGRMGRSVAEAGDVNGDGYADIVVGAPLAENPAATADEGIAWVYRGSPTGILGTANDVLESNMAGYQFGSAVSGGGDVDGDGYSDVLVGAPAANPAFAAEGGQYWFRGAVNRALNRLTRQYDADLVSPMSTNSTDYLNNLFFGIGHRARSPIQRCRVRLRWEVTFEGLPFSGAPITNSVAQTGTSAAWTTLPLAGIEIKELISKIPVRMRYKWRVRVEYDLAKLIDGQRFSRWFYGFATGIGDIGVLPVELLAFEGEALGAVNVLRWYTATEHNTARFDVQRADEGGVFSTIGAVQAAGNSASTIAYRFIDTAPPTGTAYYRLLMVDQDGAQETGPVVAIDRAPADIRVYPNPTTDVVYVVLSEGAANGLVRITDAAGRIVFGPLSPGTHTLGLDLSARPAGRYQVSVQAPDGTLLRSEALIKR